MTYFGSFPTIAYSISKKPPVIVSNIITRVAIRESLKSNGSIYDQYYVKETDTPEILAHKLYGDSNLHWILMLINDTPNGFYDWPLKEESLINYADGLYPGSTIFFLDQPGKFTKDEIVDINGVSAKVCGWDSTYKRLMIDEIDGDIQEGDMVTGDDGTGVIARLVLDSKEALHHFTTTGLPQGEWLNPYWYLNESNDLTKYINKDIYEIPEVSSSSSSTDSDSSILDAYIRRRSNFDDHIVTNYQWETHLNEQKRLKKILKAEYVPLVISEYEKLLKGE